MTIKVFRNAKILHFLGVKSEFYQYYVIVPVLKKRVDKRFPGSYDNKILISVNLSSVQLFLIPWSTL